MSIWGDGDDREPLKLEPRDWIIIGAVFAILTAWVLGPLVRVTPFY